MRRELRFWKEQPSTASGMLLTTDELLAKQDRADIIAHLPPLDGKRILDVGAGIGQYTEHFVEVARHVTAVDFVDSFIEVNRKRTSYRGNASYICADIMDLEFEESSFDFVFINWTMMYLGDTEINTLRDRLMRWLHPCGMVFLRESCFTGSTGGRSSANNPTHYRSDQDYVHLFEAQCLLLSRGNVKVYEDWFKNPHQYFWLFRKTLRPGRLSRTVTEARQAPE
jgi:phosphoethanolamine N-methyltransferase